MNAYETLSQHAALRAANPNYFADAPRNLQIAWRKSLDQATSGLYANAQAREAMSAQEEAIYLDFMMGAYTIPDSDDWLDQSLSNAVAVINRHVAWREADANYYTNASYDDRLTWFVELDDAIRLISAECAEYMLTDLANNLVNDFPLYCCKPENFAEKVQSDILTKKAIVPISYNNGMRLVYTQSNGMTRYYLSAGGMLSNSLCQVDNEIKFNPKFVDIVNNFVNKHA